MEQENKVKYTPNREGLNQNIDRLMDTLESTVDNMNRSSRMRGFTEGCLVTLGGVIVTGLIVTGIVKQKNKG